MRTHLYAFGSVCRGEIDKSSDIDLLACLSAPSAGIDANRFSIYSHERIRELWFEGNPFAWHLHLESKLLYSSDGNDFIYELGRPAEYSKSTEDCEKFRSLFLESLGSLEASSNSPTFDISCMFLAARNFATCYSLGLGAPVFSRFSPLMIENPLPISQEDFGIYARARILSTRGRGAPLCESELGDVESSAKTVIAWMNKLSERLSLESADE